MCCSCLVSGESIIRRGVDFSAGSSNTEHPLLSSRASEDKSSSTSPSLPTQVLSASPWARAAEREIRWDRI